MTKEYMHIVRFPGLVARREDMSLGIDILVQYCLIECRLAQLPENKSVVLNMNKKNNYHNYHNLPILELC